ncbi:MAG: UDP-glucose--hexose-1-phosphate uridylyltransferase [Defluviitaleaceae bacterium]|nr:UDP-glucose--hexose-1-phosphate uridylyltransferase [Defluviitaleaceae bacterium]
MHSTVESLLQYALDKELMEPCDLVFVRNQVLSYLKITADPEKFGNPNPAYKNCDNASPILAALVDNQVMEAELMNLLMPRPSETLRSFLIKYSNDPTEATNYFYYLCRSCNYIQVEHIKKNKRWIADTLYGDLEITINLSKPEKDPRDIAIASKGQSSDYPKCLLCVENIGFGGTSGHPARQNLRAIPVSLDNENWYFQYSPYLYYNEHCIVFNEKHTPMKINKGTFHKLIEFVKDFPHYFIGSNADLPIVGGSILSHDHFQGGRHRFPLDSAKTYVEYQHSKYPGISISQVEWPLSVIRLTVTGDADDTDNTDVNLAELANHILEHWRKYSDPQADIRAFSGEIPHNTVTPIIRYNQANQLELDLVLRNNRTTGEYPLGLFHPHSEWHHIKKENIGLIEVLGLAILPGRLYKTFGIVTKILAGHITFKLGNDPLLEPHETWISDLLKRYGNTNSIEKAEEILRHEIGQVFLKVLIDCGVFKDTQTGRMQFGNFIESII